MIVNFVKNNPYVAGLAIGAIGLVGFWVFTRSPTSTETTPIAAIPYDPELAKMGMQMALAREELQSAERMAINENATMLSLADIDAENVRLGIVSQRDVDLAALDTKLSMAREKYSADVALKDRDILIQQGINETAVKTRTIDADVAKTVAAYERETAIDNARTAAHAQIMLGQFNRDAAIETARYNKEAAIGSAKATKTKSIGFGKFSIKW